MAIVSSHILNSITGKSASGIRVQLIHNREIIFDKPADQEGRIHENIEAMAGEYELIFDVAQYFHVDRPSVANVVIRFSMHDNDKRYHMPVMLSPHSYSTWWSD